MTKAILAAALTLITLAAVPARADIPGTNQVHIESGPLVGVRTDNIVAFKGVPFAAPPVGRLRWKPPQAVVKWRGVRDASRFGAICPQTPNFATPKDAVQSEDCLTLNVWAPAASAKPAPVMVWIHGGGDVNGTASEPQFDGAVFAKNGIVFVSIEYRLGLLGWLAHPALTAEAGPNAPLANYGLMDQIAALQWVNRNIAAFGGDPSRVTIAGESAGGEAVISLMTVPAARGLFSQAIVESGGGWYLGSSLAYEEKLGLARLQKAGAAAGSDTTALRTLPVAALVAAEEDDIGTVIDGRLVKAGPARVFERGQAAPVPLLIGSNSGEDNLLGESPAADVLKDFTAEQLAALRKAYGEPAASDDTALAHAIFRDQFMGAPARWIAVHQSAKAPTYLYYFDYVPQIIRGRMLKAHHGVEMLFSFAAMTRGPRPIHIISGADSAEMTLVHGCWASFVKTGAPNCAGWPAYSPAGDQLLDFSDQASVRTGFNKAAYDILDGIEQKQLTGAR